MTIFRNYFIITKVVLLNLSLKEDSILNEKNTAIIAHILYDLMDPSNTSYMEITTPKFHDILYSRKLLKQTIYTLEVANLYQISMLVTAATSDDLHLDEWLTEKMEEKFGYKRLKGFLWLSNRLSAPDKDITLPN